MDGNSPFCAQQKATESFFTTWFNSRTPNNIATKIAEEEDDDEREETIHGSSKQLTETNVFGMLFVEVNTNLRKISLVLSCIKPSTSLKWDRCRRNGIRIDTAQTIYSKNNIDTVPTTDENFDHLLKITFLLKANWFLSNNQNVHYPHMM